MINFPDISGSVSTGLGEQFSDSGFLGVVTLIAGIFLGLFAVRFVIGLFRDLLAAAKRKKIAGMREDFISHLETDERGAFLKRERAARLKREERDILEMEEEAGLDIDEIYDDD